MELLGDELRIKQILNTLLSNAFKYTENGIDVAVSGFDAIDNTLAEPMVALDKRITKQIFRTFIAQRI
ncbi:MAG: hypothetical protein LBH44_12040 [Treponema sp.]|nr:hypothetical protein [Treponema sp.]